MTENDRQLREVVNLFWKLSYATKPISAEEFLKELRRILKCG